LLRVAAPLRLPNGLRRCTFRTCALGRECLGGLIVKPFHGCELVDYPTSGDCLEMHVA
jgi:hypothetical protein